MEAYRAVISLHNLGYRLMALEGDQVAIWPAVSTEHAELIMAIREEPKTACKAIQYLPQLCLIIFPAALRNFASDLFKALKDDVQLVAIKYVRGSGVTEWVFRPIHSKARKAMLEITEENWEGVMYLECEEEGERWGT